MRQSGDFTQSSVKKHCDGFLKHMATWVFFHWNSVSFSVWKKAWFRSDQICTVSEGDFPPFIPLLLQKYKGHKTCGEKFIEKDNDMVRVTGKTLNSSTLLQCLSTFLAL